MAYSGRAMALAKLATLLLSLAAGKPDLPPAGQALTRISFSSCMHQDPKGFGSDNLNFSAWDTWRRAGADVSIFTGDNVYGDCYTDACEELKQAYADLAAIPSFQRFRDQVPIIATWDDHDFGVNNGGADFGGKEVAKEEFLSFYGVPASDPRRSRGGIYTSYMWGPDDKKLQVILLDTRWFKSSETLLGAEQWAWLAQEFARPASLRILVSSIQVLGNYYEGWYEYPCEQQRLLSILPDNVVILSGDRHIGGFYQYDASQGVHLRWRNNNGRLVPPLVKKAGENEPLLEVTSSSLTHAWNEAGLEEGPHRVPGFDILRTDHFGVLDIDWAKREVVVHLLPALDSLTGSREITIEFPEHPKAGRLSGYMQSCGDLRSLYRQHTCCGNPARMLPSDISFVCDQPSGDVVSHATLGMLLPTYGQTPTDPLLHTFNASVLALMTAGEHTALAYDSMWQVPSSWNGLSFFTGPADGQGIKVLAKGKVRIYANNEIASETGTSAYSYKLSAVENRGGPGQAFPNSDESFTAHGAQVRFTDLEVEYAGQTTKYKVLAGGFAVKRLYVSTAGHPEGKLMTSADEVASTMNGLKGLSQLCGARMVLPHEFGHLTEGAGFEDGIYLGGHEDGAFGAVFALDTATGNMYLLPQPAAVEVSTPLYTANAEYVAMLMNIYPEGADGQRLHLWVGKKVGTDFLGRNGLHPSHGRHYILKLDAHSAWDNMTADVFYDGHFEPADSVSGALSGGSAKNEWSSINKLDPTMYAQALTELDDIAVVRVDLPGMALDCTSTGGSPVPCSVSAKAKRLRMTDVDPAFGDPDSLYWSPKGQLIIAEDGSTGRLLRLDLDENGTSHMNLTTLARVSDEKQRNHLNAIPQFSFTAQSQGEFTGIIPHGFLHKLDETSTAKDWLDAELEAKEQYLVNLQLHSLMDGVIKDMQLGKGSQTLRVDVDADPTDAAPQMYAWLGVGYYNGKREAYCASNDCSGMRGPFVPGEVVRVSDFEILETWRELAPGTYMNDLQAIVEESLSYKNMEKALPYAWLLVNWYNGKRETYCGLNDCSEMRGPFNASDLVLESDFEAMEMWRGLAPGTYTDDLTDIIKESLSYQYFEPVLPYVWKGVGYYNGKREEYCASNDCSGMRGPFVAGEVVLESDYAALEIWRGLAPGTYTDDLTAIIEESLSYKNMEPAGF